MHDGKEIVEEPGRVEIKHEGEKFKLEIKAAKMDDMGEIKAVAMNKEGAVEKVAHLDIIRKYIVFNSA